MKTFSIDYPTTSVSIRAARFQGKDGGDETHIMITDAVQDSMAEQLSAIESAYQHALQTLALSMDSAVFRRVYSSDLANQAETLAPSPLVGSSDESPVAVSVVEQPPMPDRRYALWAYHIGDCSTETKQQVGNAVTVKRGELTHIWSAGLTAPKVNETVDSFLQTEQIFDLYERQLDELGASLKDNVVRTWLFVQNVDNNYAGMVEARRALFEKRGLTKETHYIASTGIEGRHVDKRCNVLMDAYAIAGIGENQITYLTAEDHLGPTIDYGVTFERGTRIDYRDRRHILISGTASIDPAGNTLHMGDVVEQTKRAVKNAEALINAAGAELSDLAHLIVYMRDHADYAVIRREIEKRFPDTPTVYLRAPVCRPDWLMEIECMAIVNAENPTFHPF